MLLILFNQSGSSGPIPPKGKGKAVGGRINWRGYITAMQQRNQREREMRERLRTVLEGRMEASLESYRQNVLEMVIDKQRTDNNNLVLASEL